MKIRRRVNRQADSHADFWIAVSAFRAAFREDLMGAGFDRASEDGDYTVMRRVTLAPLGRPFYEVDIGRKLTGAASA